MRDYLFTADARGRLAAAEALLDPGTIKVLQQVGVTDGWRCLEVGAGGGSIARWLATVVGRQGLVVATDLTTEHLQVEPATVEVRQHDIVRDPLEEATYDLVHARLVLEHLPERGAVLRKLANALRPGGWLVVEDVDYVSAVPVSQLGATLHARTQALRLEVFDRKTYDALPEFLMIRECRVRVEQPGFRVKTLIVATTLLDAVEFTRDDLAQLYRARWNAELDLRSLKQTLQMDVLRCKTPELVRKELWTHILAYNLIRTIIAQAATKHGIEPRTISFKGAVQTLEAFQPVIALQGEHRPAFRRILYEHLLDAIAIHRVADRPDRYEPRRKKRRPKPYDRLMKPRWQAKRDMRNGFREN